jgi:hypothetical protein
MIFQVEIENELKVFNYVLSVPHFENFLECNAVPLGLSFYRVLNLPVKW